MEQQTQWTRPGYRPNYNGGTPPPQMGTMNRPFAQTVTPELSRAERLEAQRLAEQSRFDHAWDGGSFKVVPNTDLGDALAWPRNDDEVYDDEPEEDDEE